MSSDIRSPKKAMANTTGLPPLYKSVVALNSALHADIAIGMNDDYRFAAGASSIPVTLVEVARAQSDYPVVFTGGDKPVPVILTGLPPAGNKLVDKSGRWKPDAYVPAYLRRYPFLLAKADPGHDTLTLCIDASSGLVTKGLAKGNLFDGDEPSMRTRAALKLCEEFEAAARLTEQAMTDLMRAKILIDGQAEVRKEGMEPARLHGFQIISEELLGKLPGYELTKLAKSGALALAYAHLFSLRHLADLVDGQPATQPGQNEAAPRKTKAEAADIFPLQDVAASPSQPDLAGPETV